MKTKLTLDLVKSKKMQNFKRTCFFSGANGRSEAWHMDQSMLQVRGGLRGDRVD